MAIEPRSTVPETGGVLRETSVSRKPSARYSTNTDSGGGCMRTSTFRVTTPDDGSLIAVANGFVHMGSAIEQTRPITFGTPITPPSLACTSVAVIGSCASTNDGKFHSTWPTHAQGPPVHSIAHSVTRHACTDSSAALAARSRVLAAHFSRHGESPDGQAGMQTERSGQPLTSAQYCDSSQHACIMHGAQAGVAPSVGSPHTGGPCSWNERSSMPTTCRHDTPHASRVRTMLIR